MKITDRYFPARDQDYLVVIVHANFIGDFAFRLTFNNGLKTLVDFEPFQSEIPYFQPSIWGAESQQGQITFDSLWDFVNRISKIVNPFTFFHHPEASFGSSPAWLRPFCSSASSVCAYRQTVSSDCLLLRLFFPNRRQFAFFCVHQ
jgi:hypothetical protein